MHVRFLRALCLLTVLALAMGAAGCGMTAKVTQWYDDYMESRDTNLGKRVCVAPFTGGIKDTQSRAEAWHQGLVERIKTAGGMVLIPFAELEAAMQKLPAKVRDREERAILAGRSLGLTVLISGQITDLSVQRRLTGIYGMRENTPMLGMEGEIRVLDVANGAVAGQKSFRPEEELTDIMAENIRMGSEPAAAMVDKLAGKLAGESLGWAINRVNAVPWVGFVTTVEASRVTVTAGRDTGLPVGSTLGIYELGERIITGEGSVVHLAGPKVARGRITSLSARTAQVELLPLEDQKEVGQVKAGMLVRTY